MFQASAEVRYGRDAASTSLLDDLQPSWSHPFAFQATLEIEFMHQTIMYYTTPAATATLAEVYNQISHSYARRPGDEQIQTHLDGVKKTLAEARRGTGIEFMCFRAPRTDADKKKDKEKEKDKDKDKDKNVETDYEREPITSPVPAPVPPTPRRRDINRNRI